MNSFCKYLLGDEDIKEAVVSSIEAYNGLDDRQTQKIQKLEAKVDRLESEVESLKNVVQRSSGRRRFSGDKESGNETRSREWRGPRTLKEEVVAGFERYIGALSKEKEIRYKPHLNWLKGAGDIEKVQDILLKLRARAAGEAGEYRELSPIVEELLAKVKRKD